MHPHYASIVNEAVFAGFAIFACALLWRMSRKPPKT